MVWHSDNSYVEVPPAGSLLYALEVPIGGGGNTSFNNQYRAYETLPGELRQAIEGRGQVHDSSRNSAGVPRPGVRPPEKLDDVEGPTHPLVRVHPHTGRRALYLGRRRSWPSNYIVGLPNDESEALLDALWAHATKPELAWEHVWRDGDAVLWDNRCAMHYRTPIDSSRRRVMHRIQIAGEPVVAPWVSPLRDGGDGAGELGKDRSGEIGGHALLAESVDTLTYQLEPRRKSHHERFACGFENAQAQTKWQITHL